MSIRPTHDEMYDFWHTEQEPVNRFRLDVLLIVAAFFIMLGFVLWMIWGALDDSVQRSDAKPSICAGLGTWDCVARLEDR